MSKKTLTTAEIRLFNRSEIYQTIYKEKQVSKQTLSHLLNLSLPTVSQNLSELQSMGLIETCGVSESTGGRKPQLYSCIANARIAFGVVILKDYIQIVALDLYGNVFKKAHYTISFQNYPEYFKEICELIQNFVVSSNYSKELILGIGIATQGLVSKAGDRVIFGNILNNADVTIEHFSRYLDYPCILLHDTEAAALCEIWEQPTITDAVFLLLNRNLGGALILNGQIHSGSVLPSGIIEHMCLVPHGRRCYCGQHGCLETYCSANALMEEAGQPLEDFFIDLRQGKERQLHIWDEYLHNLALAINNILMVVNSDIILGGLLSHYIQPGDIETLRRYVSEKSAFDFFNSYHMSTSTSNTYAEAIGAALYYINNFLNQIVTL